MRSAKLSMPQLLLVRWARLTAVPSLRSFMLERVNESKDGYVDLNLICSFTRMREILKARTSPP